MFSAHILESSLFSIQTSGLYCNSFVSLICTLSSQGPDPAVPLIRAQQRSDSRLRPEDITTAKKHALQLFL